MSNRSCAGSHVRIACRSGGGSARTCVVQASVTKVNPLAAKARRFTILSFQTKPFETTDTFNAGKAPATRPV